MTLSAALALGAVAPGLAIASEADSEQEGTAPPGALPGLEEGSELGPGGEEAVLEDLPGAVPPGEGEVEAPIETEPPQEQVPAPLSPEAPPVPIATDPPSTEPPAPPDAAPPAPEYSPSYEPAPPSVPVEGDPLIAPSPAVHGGQPDRAAQPTVKAQAPAPSPAEPEEATAPEQDPPATLPPTQPGEVSESLTGRPVHKVRSGECLWSIAEALLSAGAGDAEIAAEVARLWNLNAERIGTGDPNLILVGTELRLH